MTLEDRYNQNFSQVLGNYQHDVTNLGLSASQIVMHCFTIPKVGFNDGTKS